MCWCRNGRNLSKNLQGLPKHVRRYSQGLGKPSKSLREVTHLVKMSGCTFQRINRVKARVEAVGSSREMVAVIQEKLCWFGLGCGILSSLSAHSPKPLKTRCIPNVLQ